MNAGVSRFYINEVVAENPYLKAKVTPFKDSSELNKNVDALEKIVFDEIRVNIKLMQIVFPQKNFTISDAILACRPPTESPGIRSVVLQDAASELERQIKFSYAVLDMLQTSPATKLSILQVRRFFFLSSHKSQSIYLYNHFLIY